MRRREFFGILCGAATFAPNCASLLVAADEVIE